MSLFEETEPARASSPSSLNKFRIYWWAKTEKRFQGSDVVELEQEELSEYEADEILEYNATFSFGKTKSYLKNFSERYNNATFCENFGVRKVVKL